MFQSTHPCGVRLLSLICKICTFSFNPRTRVGCDRLIRQKLYSKFVSIHAPVWGATRRSSNNRGRSCFNPRTRVGCDWIQGECDVLTDVSIHAPVWGATIVNSTSSGVLTRFNPRTRVGCDGQSVRFCDYKTFQSTHPCGVRLSKYKKVSKQRRFNPRTRVGCDNSPANNINAMMFQSTHPCGV